MKYLLTAIVALMLLTSCSKSEQLNNIPDGIITLNGDSYELTLITPNYHKNAKLHNDEGWYNYGINLPMYEDEYGNIYTIPLNYRESIKKPFGFNINDHGVLLCPSWDGLAKQTNITVSPNGIANVIPKNYLYKTTIYMGDRSYMNFKFALQLNLEA